MSNMVIIHDTRCIYAVSVSEYKACWRDFMPYVTDPEEHNHHVMRVTYGEHVRYIDMYAFKDTMKHVGETRIKRALQRGKHESRYQKSLERRGVRGTYRD